MSSGGTRVSIDFTFPWTEATVGVWTAIALSPTFGTLLPAATLIWEGEVATSFLSSFVTALTRYEPGIGKRTWET